MAGVVEEVTDENYEQFRQAQAAVIAYSLASCEPCKAYDPILEDAAKKFPTVKFGKAMMHIPGRCREIKKSHTFVTYPTTHLFSRGTLLLSREGLIEPGELVALITHYLLHSTDS
jgi:thiol-disulfide isomerase/thioredoxin